MKDKPDGTVDLDDHERGLLILSAAIYGLKWSLALGTASLLFAFLSYPESIVTALWWYPMSFIGFFLWKRTWLLAEAQAIIDRTNAHIQE